MDSKWRELSPDEYSDNNEFIEDEFGTYSPNFFQKILIYIGKKSFLKRGLFRSKYTQIIMSLQKGPLDIYFRECAFRVYGDNNLIEYGMLLDPEYNSDDIEFLLEDSSQNSNFIDLGSNIGLYSQPFAKASPSGTVISIDANPLMKSRLSFNIISSGIENIHVTSCAVSDKIGRGSLFIRKNDTAIVSIAEDKIGSIKIDTLENIIKNKKITSIHGLKIDIEGHEDKALAPFLLNATETLLPKKIVIEKLSKNSDYPECTLAFNKLNYKLISRSKNNSFYERD